MSRTVKEWCGATDDTKAPPRVRARIFVRENGICHISGRQIQPGEIWEADHKIAIINGGKNVESNLFPALKDKHKEKTKDDLAEKSRVAEIAKKHIGITRPAGKIRSPGFFRKSRPHEGREPVVGVPAFMRQIATVENES